MDYRKKFVVDPGTKVRLSKIDASYTGTHETRDKALPEIQANVERMGKLQYLLYADGSQSLLVVLQALDAAGKDGTIRHVFSGMNPQGTFVFGFKQPSREEAAHDFLWRAHQRAPAKGEVVIFNRSHYEDVLVVRVHKLVPHSVWSKRHDLINDFETMVSQNGTTILKFFQTTSARKSSWRASSSGSMIQRGTGRSAKAITPNASCGRNTWRPTRTPWP
jgi:polyphosphate kinase 2 (PPK2 family)